MTGSTKPLRDADRACENGPAIFTQTVNSGFDLSRGHAGKSICALPFVSLKEKKILNKLFRYLWTRPETFGMSREQN